ncbi:MAG: hypothetical protein ACI9EF_003165 [Pseudohongiellaceae bacterium]|jgi:hypothetical protein
MASGPRRWALQAPGRALSILLIGCLCSCVSAPPARVETPWGTARAATAGEARELALMLADLVPRVRDLLPDSRDRLNEIWLDDFARLKDRPEVVGLASLDSGRIRIRADRLGQDADFVLVHELVHALQGSSWDPLPAVMKEGLCDALSCRLIPEMAPRVRAMRQFDAATSAPSSRLELVFFEPLLHEREVLDIALAPREGVVPHTVLAQPGRGIHLNDAGQDQGALYGIGMVVTERTMSRVGLAGLHNLCERAGRMGLETVPLGWLLDVAGLSRDPASWHREIVAGISSEELSAQVAFLAKQLADHVVTVLRPRFPDLDSDRFLASALPTLGWREGPARVALGTVPEFREALRESWDLARPQVLRPGDGLRVSDATGIHVTSVSDPRNEQPPGLPAGSGDYTITRLSLGGAVTVAEALWAGGLPGGGLGMAQVEALVRLGQDENGLWISSRARDGFDVFGIELEGLVVADLTRDLNVVTNLDEDGFLVVTARLPGERRLDQLALYHPEANLVVFQRFSGADHSRDQRFPLWVPLAR